jgi:inner membrane transporter RhtA
MSLAREPGLPRLGLAERIPPHVFFLVSAVFHYLGPAFAVLLFSQVSEAGVAWLRIASAALVFALWRAVARRRPGVEPPPRWRSLIGLGLTLGLMNLSFYEAISRLPLSTVGAIEFVGPILLAALGARTRRNVAALALAAGGGWLLTGARLEGEPAGYLFAFANCALFMLYIVLGHRVARDGGAAGIDRLGAAMLIALVPASVFGLGQALPAFKEPRLLAAGAGVGICSSVVPYVCDQLAMARLPRATFALLLALLPASATLIGIGVLGQVPAAVEALGILLVGAGVVLHKGHAVDEPEAAAQAV